MFKLPFKSVHSFIVPLKGGWSSIYGFFSAMLLLW